MAEESKAINWNSVVTNAVSTLVAAVFVGAAIIVWDAATTIDTKIEAATNNIGKTQGKLDMTQQDLQASQKTMADEIASLHVEIKKLSSQLSSHEEILRTRQTTNNMPKDKPIILPKYEVPEKQLSDFRKKDVERVFKVFEKNRFDIQQQAIQKR